MAWSNNMPSTIFVKTPIGVIQVVSKNSIIISSKFVDKKIKFFSDSIIGEDIGSYFNGESNNLESKYKLIGTDFQIKVWKEICKIPYGETLTYGEIAKRIGQPSSCLALREQEPLSRGQACSGSGTARSNLVSKGAG